MPPLEAFGEVGSTSSVVTYGCRFSFLKQISNYDHWGLYMTQPDNDDPNEYFEFQANGNKEVVLKSLLQEQNALKDQLNQLQGMLENLIVKRTQLCFITEPSQQGSSHFGRGLGCKQRL